jgi:hypothetical protein
VIFCHAIQWERHWASRIQRKLTGLITVEIRWSLMMRDIGIYQQSSQSPEKQKLIDLNEASMSDMAIYRTKERFSTVFSRHPSIWARTQTGYCSL